MLVVAYKFVCLLDTAFSPNHCLKCIFGTAFLALIVLNSVNAIATTRNQFVLNCLSCLM